MQKRTHARPILDRIATPETENPAADMRVTSLLRALGEVVYFAQASNMIVKIGHTVDLNRRRYEWVPAAQLLAFRFGTYDDEQAIHARLIEDRAHGREWYHPTPAVMAEVDAAREWMLSHVAA